MGCFACFDLGKQDKKALSLPNGGSHIRVAASEQLAATSSRNVTNNGEAQDPLRDSSQHIAAQTFTFRELAAATKHFRSDYLIGEGGFGRVYKGRLESTGQIVAVKQLDRNGLQGNREFLVEVLMLSLLHHPNLVNLIGYCADGDQRLLVYEYMPLGCLEDHLHDLPPDKEALDWNTRMKIAAGAARGMEYLHDQANPPVIYRDFKSSNILLDENFHPKLSDFGLAKLGPVGDKTHVSTRVMGTYGYCAPEYAMTGQLTVKSDVYSFGVVLLEIITGRKAIDNSRSAGEHNLVSWARPLFKDRRKFHQMADPSLQGCYPMRGLYQAIAVAAMCLQEDATNRPVTGDVVTALNYLAAQNYDPKVHPVNKFSPSPSRDKREKEKRYGNGDRQGEGERGLVERMFRQGGTRSPASNSPDNLDRVMRQQTRTRYSPDNRILRQIGAGSSASNSPDNYGLESGLSRLNGTQSPREHNVQEGLLSRLKGSPQQAGRIIKSYSDRERAVAEARMWGENWRERKRGNLCASDGSLDSVLI
ncbi:hypothetical protein KP509_07G016300 [Ceratopteris richardii]|uniref:non-specific serine/threonine protein kinase n=1 Tax=Ceratopteris richardii TaxID=49495 RepID=A0A8T2UIT7_CERRI|nr:hypothetical protein KP509_07G016300 [Ceratopteris richardii]